MQKGAIVQQLGTVVAGKMNAVMAKNLDRIEG